MNEFENNNQNNDNFNFNNTGESYSPPNYTQPIYDAPPIIQSFDGEYQKPPKPPKEKKAKNGHSTGTVILSCVLAAIIGATSGIVAMWGFFKSNDSDDSEPVKNNQTSNNSDTNISINVDEDATSVAEAVAKKCTNSVVGIRTTLSVSDFFGGSQEQSGEGSGVVYSSDGYIITNYHVIGDAAELTDAKIEVFFGDSKSESYPAKVVGYNISCDLAVIKIEAENLTPLEFADSDKLQIGQNVVTIGAPGGLEFMGSVTYGIISGLNRIVSADSQLELIQIDAAINPGNSGGALLNIKGELIGINSSKIAATEFEGMGFAIPSNAVKEKCDKIISKGGDDGVYLGVSISTTYTSEVLRYYGYPAGAVISSVVDDSPADKAGIKRGDIITEFNGTKISEYTVINDVLYDCEPGQMVDATIYRDGKYHDIKITLASDGS